MTMRLSWAGSRIIILFVTALLLGSWNLIGWLSRPSAEVFPAETTHEPGLQAELIGVGGSWLAAEPGSCNEIGSSDTGMDAQGEPRIVRVDHLRAVEVVQKRLDNSYVSILDDVFAPSRFVRETSVGAASDLVQFAADLVVSEQGESGGASSTAEKFGIASPVIDLPDTKQRLETENTYHEVFLALASKDAEELLRRAEIVMKVEGEKCQQVAMLRALYEVDRRLALEYFGRAVFTLPNRSSPEGVSVPVFAMEFLSKRVTDPTVRMLLERIAWMANPNVSPDLRQHAARSLIATATEVDLQRYASYPGYHELDEAPAIADGEVVR